MKFSFSNLIPALIALGVYPAKGGNSLRYSGMIPQGGNLGPFSGAQAAKGCTFTVNQNVSVKGLSFFATVAAGGTYKGKLVALDGANAITAVLGSFTVNPTVAGTLTGIEGIFAAPAALVPGTTYAAFLCRTDQPANFALEVLGTGNGVWAAPGFNRSATFANSSANVDPGLGNTLTTGGGPYYAGFIL